MKIRPHSRRISMLAASLAVVLLSPSCGGDRSVTSTPPLTTPVSNPTTPPADDTCPLGLGTVDVSCYPEGPQLASQIDAAIDMLVDEHPELLDLTSETAPGSGWYKVVDREGYLDTMVENLRRMEFCAERDSDDVEREPILVKESNDYSERFDVLSDKGFIQRGETAYLTTCAPASFPVVRTADMPPAGSGCFPPYPPPITRFTCDVHLFAPECHTVDATPKVGPNPDYCARIGFHGHSICPLRPEGAPDRVACENWRVGVAEDTGRYGPTWTNGEGEWCTGTESNCRNHEDNQYQVCVFRSGIVKATAENGADCTKEVAR